MTEQQPGMLDGQPGFYVGDADNPDLYRLQERAGRGGEGTVWQATTHRRDGEKHRWAVKIMPAEKLRVAHEESDTDALDRSYQRAQEAQHETGQLQREVPGVVGATKVFCGPRPHPPGAAAADIRTLYVVSPWIDGADLTRWLRPSTTFTQVCDVAKKLAVIVDGIADSRFAVAHRDISPANVMIEAETDTVWLIDFTFVVPTRSGPVTIVNNKGYTAPEALAGRGSAAADRYSFGGVVFFLLTGCKPASRDAATDSYEQLVRTSRPTEVAAHVAALLSAEPDDRPTSLVRWAAELAELATATPAGLRYADLDVTVDGFRITTVTALGNTVLARARLGPGALWALVPDDAAPTGLVVLRCVTDGAGNTVQFVIDKAERIMFGQGSAWHDVGRAAVSAGLAVVRTATGSATAYVVDPACDRLSTVDVLADGTTHLSSAGPYVRRVLAATINHDGIAVVAAISPVGDLVMITDDDVDYLGATEVRSATVGLNTLGEPVCFAATATEPELKIFEQRYGQWLPTGTITTPGSMADVACVGQRDGMTLAVAGADGLWVATRFDGGTPAWQCLTDRHSYRVALEVGAAWRIQLAAIVDGQVVVATEDFAGHWSTTAITR